MKKTIIALAVAGFSFNAAAADLNAIQIAGKDFPLFAKEVVIPATGLQAVSAAGFDTSVLAGATVANGDERFVRFELTNAKFKAPLTSAQLVVAASAAAVDPAVTANDANGKFVVFKITGATDGVVATTKLKLDLAELVLTTGENATITYSLYRDSAKAIEGSTAAGEVLASKSGPIASFDNALVVTASQSTDISKIKASAYTGFANNTNVTNLFKLDVKVKDTDANGNTGIQFAKVANADAQLTMADLLQGDTATPSKLTVTGNFAADTAETSGIGGFTKISVKPTEATYKLTNAANVNSNFVFAAAGTKAIPAGSYSATLNLVAANAGIKLANEGVFSFADVASLQREGATNRLDLVFSPATSYPQFVRITNGTNLPGVVNLTVYNDAGDFASFPLTAIAGQPAELAGQASTTQLSTAAIFAAAQAAKPTFNVVNDKKMRIEVSSTAGKMKIQSYVVSKDGQNLGRFR